MKKAPDILYRTWLKYLAKAQLEAYGWNQKKEIEYAKKAEKLKKVIDLIEKGL